MLDQKHIELLKGAIIKDVFMRDEAKHASERGGEDMQWLFDFRAAMLRPDVLNAFAETFVLRYRDKAPLQVCGLEVAGIPLVAAIVMKSLEHGVPMNGFFIRKSRKKSGLLKMIEGTPTSDPVVVVDDLINSGGSIARVLDVLHEGGLRVDEIFSILRFRDTSAYTFRQGDTTIDLHALFSLDDFAESLNVKNLIRETKTPPPPIFSEKPLWYYRGRDPSYFYVVPKSGPVLSRGIVYSGEDSGHMNALDLKTGEMHWSFKVPFGVKGKRIFSTPTIWKNTLFFGAYDGNLYALDITTGKKRWIFLEADWIGSSPCVAGDLGILFIGLEFGLLNKRGGVAGIRAEDGEKVWEFRSPELTHGSPAYSKKFSVVGCGSNDGIFSMLDAKTGKLLWQKSTEGPIKYAPRFADTHDVVVVLGHGEVVYVLDTKTGAERARYVMGFGGYATPLVVGDTVIVTSLDKHVHAFDIRDGTPKWKFMTGARCFATPELVGEKVYVGSNDAVLYELEPKTGTCTGVFRTRERIVNKIAYDSETGIFIIPTFANELFAIKKS